MGKKVSVSTKVKRKLAFGYQGLGNTIRYTGKSDYASAYWYDGIPNFGDLFTPYLLEYLYGLSARNVRGVPRPLIQQRVLFGAGSILQNLNTACVTVWGSGFAAPPRKRIRNVPGEVLAIRGPRTANIAKDLGWPAASIYGDPGLLASRIVPKPRTAEVSYGIIPHFAHFDRMCESLDPSDVRLIDVRKPLTHVLKQISGCEMVFSSSLHGLIVAHSMNIPAVRIAGQYSLSGGDFKFEDYFESVDIAHYPVQDNFSTISSKTLSRYRHLASKLRPQTLEEIQDKLLLSLQSSQFIRDSL